MLTDTQLRRIKRKPKLYRLYDKDGLLLEIPSSEKAKPRWRLKYRFQGRECRMSLGLLPAVSLADARVLVRNHRAVLAKGINPSQFLKDEQRRQTQQRANSFEQIADEWLEIQSAGWAANQIKAVKLRLAKHLTPQLGQRPIAGITAPDLLAVFRKIEEAGFYETAHRCRSICSRVFRFAIATGLAEHDPAADLVNALKRVNHDHYARITDPAQVGALMRAIQGYEGYPIVRAALLLQIYTMTRPGEVRGATWSEFDLSVELWRVPAVRMKRKKEHLVPLSRQAVTLLSDLHQYTGSSDLLFQSVLSRKTAISDNTVRVALRRMGYTKNEITPHGFRAMASTLLHEQGWASDWVEKQLAHATGSKTAQAYNAAEHIAGRREMLQGWADYLDGLERGGRVLSIGSGK